jgi:hypothetical protein
MGMPAGQVRHVHSQTALGGIRVPVFTADAKGDPFEGHIRVPNELVRTKPFTKERHRFQDLIASNVKRWVEWREHKGWRLNSKPKVKGPYDWPTANAQAEQPDYSLYVVTALFQPTETLSMSIDDAWELKRRAELFGVDTSKPKPTSTPIEAGPDVIFDSGPFRDPMVIAEERRQAMGVKREEFLIGPLSEPWPERKHT